MGVSTYHSVPFVHLTWSRPTSNCGYRGGQRRLTVFTAVGIIPVSVIFYRPACHNIVQLPAFKLAIGKLVRRKPYMFVRKTCVPYLDGYNLPIVNLARYRLPTIAYC